MINVKKIFLRKIKKPNEIYVPLTSEEIDQILLSLRLTNKAFKGYMKDELEDKMSNYSMKAKTN